jgi:hypothetical protein
MQYVPAQSQRHAQRQSTNEGLGCDVEQQRRNPSEPLPRESAQRALLLPVNLPFQIPSRDVYNKELHLVEPHQQTGSLLQDAAL